MNWCKGQMMRDGLKKKENENEAVNRKEKQKQKFDVRKGKPRTGTSCDGQPFRGEFVYFMN